LVTSEFPKEVSAQNARAQTLIHELVLRVLGREEPFSISLRRGGTGTIRYARNSTLLLVPPVEVFIAISQSYLKDHRYLEIGFILGEDD
jgi:hypothetical protein